MAILIVFCALALFWLSTRQLPLIVRALIWISGAGLLAFAAFGFPPSDEFGLRLAVQDAWVQRSDLGNAAIAHALQRNAGTVAQFVPQLLDFFLIAAAALAILALLAFTPGERLERALRPTILALVGFIAGSVATLAVVAVGLGGQVKPWVITGYLAPTVPNQESPVYDGDTFRLGDISLRLYGVDAPERHQECRGLNNCGAVSRDALEHILSGTLIQCEQHRTSTAGHADSFGRPLVKCDRIEEGHRIDVAAWMISNGYAVPYEGDERYGYVSEQAEGADRNIMRACSLRPDVWRRDRAARRLFEDGATPAPENAMGHCPAP